MNIKTKSILITEANRGIGRALVEEALKRGAKRVYAEEIGAVESRNSRSEDNSVRRGFLK